MNVWNKKQSHVKLLTMKTVVIAVVVVLCATLTTQQKFVIPEVSIRALAPKGLEVSIPDSPGIQLFAFHGNINQNIKGKSDGAISKEVQSVENGRWKFTDNTVQLKPGDVLHYWIFVQHNRLGFDKQDQQYTVGGLATGGGATAPVCAETATKINGGQNVCGNTVIFEDNFSGPSIDSNKWTVEQYIPSSPDYEFNSYEKSAENGYISNNNLYLKCTLRKDPYLDQLDLSNGCTGKNCKTQAVAGMIPPPVIGGRVKSKFSFLYGKIEIRAHLPRGDWIFPELYLEPKNNAYGAGYNSGRVWVAYARGNQDLKTTTNDQIGNNVLYSGPVLHSREPGRSVVAKTVQGSSWGLGFHTYILTWKPDGFSFTVDGVDQFTIRPPNGAFSSLKESAKIPHASAWTSSMAPFDQEFMLTLGIGAGGRSDFPDKCSSNGVQKPWKNTNTGAIVNMLKAQADWFPSWADDASSLKVDYIKITSL